jgi:hypothetical protein
MRSRLHFVCCTWITVFFRRLLAWQKPVATLLAPTESRTSVYFFPNSNNPFVANWPLLDTNNSNSTTDQISLLIVHQKRLIQSSSDAV